MLRTTVCACLLALVPAPLAAAQDPASSIGAGRVEERLAAIRDIEELGHDRAEDLLLGALDDADWEVVERAAAALGRRGGKDSIKPLAALAADGPIRRIRAAAARSVVRLDPDKGLDRLVKQVRGRSIATAADSLAAGLEALTGEADLGRTAKLLEHKDGDVRGSIARAVMLVDPTPARIGELLALDDVRVRAGALEALAGRATPEHLPPVIALLAEGAPTDVVARRAHGLLVDVLVKDARLIEGAAEAVADLPPAEGARLGRRLLFDPLEASRQQLARSLAERAAAADDVEARALAAVVFERLGADAGDALAALATDEAPRVRLRAVQALGRVDALGHGALLAERLAAEPDADVRREVATALGRRTLGALLPALVKALEDPDPGVALCAAVSIGKLSTPSSVLPLERLRADHDDWRLRAAAAVGLGLVYRPEALPALIAALEDDDPIVVLCAHEALRRLSTRLDIEPTAEAWQAWYDDGGARLRFTHPEDDAERRAEYGYGVPDAEIYRGLDVVVLESRADHIQDLLERLGIDHRLTQSSAVRRDGLHPDAIFFANCTGEIERGDVELLEWFVLCGGQLFGSCWALTETIARTFPGVIAKVETRSEVLDDVEAFACVADSPFLNGVFPPGTRPVYQLEGAHLIDVVAPERAEVLIDSPDAADAWGEGNLAAWFTVGHGAVLDSANHFDLQGLAAAPGVSKPDERRAYAVDHMGIDYARLRELDASDDDVWKNSAHAAREVPDLSAFRFVTNFVRRKRAGDL